MKNVIKFLGLALLTFTFAFTNVEKKIIVIDVSHGGEDKGAIEEGFNEKEISLSIAKKIQELNLNSTYEIVLTRNSDEFISLEERAKIINDLKPEFVISLHINLHSNKNKNGTEIYISENSKEKEKSEKLAQDISNSFENRNVEIKNANFLLLRSVDYPIALVELGFLSNENDRKLLTSEDGQIEFAKSILNVIR